jgi:hypothetical protein
MGEAGMKASERSSGLFELALRCGIPLGPGEVEGISDEAFLTFREVYLAWAKERDSVLKGHLAERPTLFRCYLPFTARVFRVAYEIMWYFDEILVRDPVVRHVGAEPEGNLHNRKQNLLEVLGVLNHFRESVESGYILLAGPALAPPRPEQPPEIASKLLEERELEAELDETVRFGVEARKDDQGREWDIWTAELDWTGSFGWHAEKLSGGGASPSIRMGERLPEVPAARMSEILKSDVFEMVRGLYPLEIHGVLHEAAVARRLDSVVLSDRRVDASILVRADAQMSPQRQAATVGGMNLVVPYLRGLPAGHLLEVRNAIPEAFLDFRSRLADIMVRAARDDPENASEAARVLAEREIQPALNQLGAEMEAASRRARVLGVGLPVVALTGCLFARALGVGLEAQLLSLVGAGTGLLQAAAEYHAHRAEVGGKPFYFLWRAQQE